MGSEDILDYRTDADTAADDRSAEELYEQFIDQYGTEVPREKVRIVASDPLEIVFDNGSRTIIGPDGATDHRPSFAPIGRKESDETGWDNKAFLDAGDAMFSDRE